MFHRGDSVLLDGEPAIVVSADEDGTVQVRSDHGLLVSSLDYNDEIDGETGSGWFTTPTWKRASR